MKMFLFLNYGALNQIFRDVVVTTELKTFRFYCLKNLPSSLSCVANMECKSCNHVFGYEQIIINQYSLYTSSVGLNCKAMMSL